MVSSFFIDVYGCQMNVHDSEIAAGILMSSGFRRVEEPDSADVILIFSCAVREHAETRVLGRVSQLGGQWRHRKEGKPVIVLCGCVAQEHGEDLLKKLRDLDLVVGPDCYDSLPELLRREARSALVEFRDTDYSRVQPDRGLFPRSYVTIMRGCDNYCSYCIVPFVRGRERSRKIGEILREVESLREDGYGEITLLGQNVNSFRDGSIRFPELLERVADAAGDSWIRFVTSHPRDFGDEIIRVMASRDNICNHLHLPVQSGSDRILKLMNRGYTSEEYLEKIGRLRAVLPGAVLTTDVIAGFPGEGEMEFEDTVRLLEKVRFDYAFLFRYSQRSGTAACRLPEQVEDGIALQRLKRLQILQRGITVEHSRALEGRILPVLVTGGAREPGQTAARTMGNRMVILESPDLQPGDRIDVRITRADGWTHFAEEADAGR